MGREAPVDERGGRGLPGRTLLQDRGTSDIHRHLGAGQPDHGPEEPGSPWLTVLEGRGQRVEEAHTLAGDVHQVDIADQVAGYKNSMHCQPPTELPTLAMPPLLEAISKPRHRAPVAISDRSYRF